ncbi:hypothetical protein AAG570_006436 [Ranatra chinensis]|uniref:Calmodulin-lysine N-methyltransferase n=1 Tax=Ranatra chinensis TaxID=642074 RepID=A0ABD0Z4L2_9HEMI
MFNLEKTKQAQTSSTISKQSGEVQGREAARRRWGILAKDVEVAHEVINEGTENVSVRRISNFGLVDISLGDEGNWFLYSVGDKYFAKIRHVWPQPLTPEDLMGFNNTGNVCVWPSEEVLAYYLLMSGVLRNLEGKSVLELGGGMTCLAGVFAAKYGRASRVHLTDGNPYCVENVKSIIEENELIGEVTCSVLLWDEDTSASEDEPCFYDILLAADCLFFDDARMDLVQAMWCRMKEDGSALVTAPRRGRTLDLFLECAVTKGFAFDLLEYYDPRVWQRHLELQATCPHYSADIHYPVLIALTKTTKHNITLVDDSSTVGIVLNILHDDVSVTKK